MVGVMYLAAFTEGFCIPRPVSFLSLSNLLNFELGVCFPTFSFSIHEFLSFCLFTHTYVMGTVHVMGA